MLTSSPNLDTSLEPVFQGIKNTPYLTGLRLLIQNALTAIKQGCLPSNTDLTQTPAKQTPLSGKALFFSPIVTHSDVKSGLEKKQETAWALALDFEADYQTVPLISLRDETEVQFQTRQALRERLKNDVYTAVFRLDMHAQFKSILIGADGLNTVIDRLFGGLGALLRSQKIDLTSTLQAYKASLMMRANRFTAPSLGFIQETLTEIKSTLSSFHTAHLAQQDESAIYQACFDYLNVEIDALIRIVNHFTQTPNLHLLDTDNIERLKAYFNDFYPKLIVIMSKLDEKSKTHLFDTHVLTQKGDQENHFCLFNRDATLNTELFQLLLHAVTNEDERHDVLFAYFQLAQLNRALIIPDHFQYTVSLEALKNNPNSVQNGCTQAAHAEIARFLTGGMNTYINGQKISETPTFQLEDRADITEIDHVVQQIVPESKPGLRRFLLSGFNPYFSALVDDLTLSLAQHTLSIDHTTNDRIVELSYNADTGELVYRWELVFDTRDMQNTLQDQDALTDKRNIASVVLSFTEEEDQIKVNVQKAVLFPRDAKLMKHFVSKESQAYLRQYTNTTAPKNKEERRVLDFLP
jgi:hypothetical protein